ncbi:MAG: FAD binding domain-containing protein, partial [Alphaproteobacteria bacterium]|nr:FAD binding domain-containing protein [Alphaproteobacteria bacterium]
MLEEIAVYCRDVGIAESTFGRRALNDGKFVARLRRGKAVTTATMEGVRTYMARRETTKAKARKAPTRRMRATVKSAAKKETSEQEFRFYDNRQKYLMFVHTCSEKRVIADRVALLKMALRHVGHFQTRNRGTIGGSVAHADPSAEIPLVLVTLGGKIALTSGKNQQRLAAAEDFFQGVLMTDCRPGEMLVALHWPCLPPHTGYGFEEVAARQGDLAVAAVACAVNLDRGGEIEELRLGLGGVEDRPRRL